MDLLTLALSHKHAGLPFMRDIHITLDLTIAEFVQIYWSGVTKSEIVFSFHTVLLDVCDVYFTVNNYVLYLGIGALPADTVVLRDVYSSPT